MANEPTYWRSLKELYDGKSVSAAKADEFLSGVTDEFKSSELSGMSRKQFLALLSASAAFAAAGCRNYRDKGEIVPYTKKPEEVTPGVPNYYASTCNGCSQSCGILIKTREGRPIKVDGNPDHPVNRGKICAAGQASILNLYDPSRLKEPQYGSASGRSGSLTWKDADLEIVKHLNDAVQSKKEIAVIVRGVYSPTAKSVLDDFVKKYPMAKVYSYNLFNDENRRRAWEQCYGNKEMQVIDWQKAKIVLALEADFLGTDGMVMEQVREFTDGRDIMKSKDFNRLYCIEGTMSMSGANADYRLRLRPDAQEEFVLALKDALERSANDALELFAAKYGITLDVLQKLVNDLLAHRGESIIYAGNVLPESVHSVVHYLNDMLGNKALYQNQDNVTTLALSSPEELDALVRKMKSGDVGVVIHVDSNPAYHFPKAFDYQHALAAVPFSVALVEADNETAQYCTMALPVNHAFESWGDAKVRTGILSSQQPVIAPLYDTRQKEAALLVWIQGKYSETLYHEYLMNRWEQDVFPLMNGKTDFKTFWYSSLHDGVIEYNERTIPVNHFNAQALKTAERPADVSGLSLVLTESYFIGDGAFANNGWLQELPHPLSKIVWDNYAAVSVATAKKLNVQNNDLIQVELPSGKVTLPVFIQPGQADDTVSASLGYGRTNAGPVGSNVGVDANILSRESLTGARIFSGVTVSKANGTYALATTQEHHALDDEFTKELHLKRKIIREGTTEEYKTNPNFLHEEKTELFSIAKEIHYNGVKWAMAIDLNKCTGCNACVAGCNVENNIPVVGKEQAGKGREMQWIRIDRYYAGTDETPSPSHQPMLCQHCDNAPCENVCPVSATNHSPDGLNQMVYNRCVGTKYCSNNCPYKVRRFNFFNWSDNFANGYYEAESVTLVHNPEVTVRSRGVMEKCTFCIQRIMEGRQHAAEQGRDFDGSSVKTACQEACPATAIVFGNMNDANSEIAKYRKHELGYHVLEELNVRPNVTYLAKLRNV